MSQLSAIAFAETDRPKANPESGEHECLRCYLMRVVDEHGCDGDHRWTLRWQQACAPHANGLIPRLRGQGGWCGCEVIFDAMPDYPDADSLLPCAGVPACLSVASTAVTQSAAPRPFCYGPGPPVTVRARP